MMRHVDRLLIAVTTWAIDHPDILGVALVGSYAHGTARPDSDVDLVIVAENPATYLEKRDWITRFGTVISCEHEDWGLVHSLRVFYEFGKTPPSPQDLSLRESNAGEGRSEGEMPLSSSSSTRKLNLTKESNPAPLEVEFGLTSIAWPSPPIDDGTARVIRDGMRVLVDKTGLLAQAIEVLSSNSCR